MGYFTFVTTAKRWILRQTLKRGVVKKIQEQISIGNIRLVDVKGSYMFYLDKYKASEKDEMPEIERILHLYKEEQLNIEQEIEVLKEFDKSI